MSRTLQLALSPAPVYGECLPALQVRLAALVVVVVFTVVLVVLGCEPLLAIAGAVAVVTATDRLLRR